MYAAKKRKYKSGEGCEARVAISPLVVNVLIRVDSSEKEIKCWGLG